jgi:hypothetical protein
MSSMSIDDVVDNPRDKVCKQAGWAFVGFVKSGKRETGIPIGVYTDYKVGRAHANAWMKSTTNALRWEATQLYEPLEDE